MAADSDETLMDSPSEDTEVSVVTFGESGYSSSPFLIQIALTLAYNGFKIVMLSKDEFDSKSHLNCIQGPPTPPIHPESAKNITFLQKIVNHETLVEWLFSLSYKTTLVSALIIDKVDLYFKDANIAALVLAVLRHTVNTYGIKLIISLSENGLKYNSLVESILSPDKTLRCSWGKKCVELRDSREGIVLQYELCGDRQITLSQLLREQVKIFLDRTS